MIGILIFIAVVAAVAGMLLLIGLTEDSAPAWWIGFTLTSLVAALIALTYNSPPPMSSSKGWDVDTVYTMQNGVKTNVEYVVKQKE